MKPWHPQRDRARELLSKEVGYVAKPHGGRLRVALAFPNTYFVGMSNLGFQTVYKLFNAEDDIVCERVFLPPKSELAAQLATGEPLVTIESQTPVGEFDIFAFSVSFEWDYTNVLTLLRLAGLKPRADARTHHDPLVMIGGARPSPALEIWSSPKLLTTKRPSGPLSGLRCSLQHQKRASQTPKGLTDFQVRRCVILPSLPAAACALNSAWWAS